MEDLNVKYVKLNLRAFRDELTKQFLFGPAWIKDEDKIFYGKLILKHSEPYGEPR